MADVKSPFQEDFKSTITSKKEDIKYTDIFSDIQEDKFDSSDDDVEKRKNERLQRLSKVAAPHHKHQTSEMK